jgi:DNA-directed RNA polymerase specialized sigma24 family protein
MTNEDIDLLHETLAGARQLPEDVAPSWLDLVRDALRDVPPRDRAFLTLDLIQALTPQEIMSRLRIRTRTGFARRKFEALTALRQALEARIGPS